MKMHLSGFLSGCSINVLLSFYQSNYFILKYVVLTYIKYACFAGFVCHLIMYLPTYVKYV